MTPAAALWRDEPIIMLMKSRDIARAEWQEFVDSFSRQCEGSLVSFTIETGYRQHQFLFRDFRMHGVAAELRPDRDEVVIFTGNAAHLTHVIQSPSSVVAGQTDEGEETSLTIRNDEGARVTIEFRPPVSASTSAGVMVDTVSQ